MMTVVWSRRGEDSLEFYVVGGISLVTDELNAGTGGFTKLSWCVYVFMHLPSWTIPDHMGSVVGKWRCGHRAQSASLQFNDVVRLRSGINGRGCPQVMPLSFPHQLYGVRGVQ